MPRSAVPVAALVLLLVAFACARAQPSVVVDGTPVAGATTELVAGVTYAPADALADALGADYLLDLRTLVATFTLGARVVQLDLVETPTEAAAAAAALRVDGRAVADGAGVLDGAAVMVPVAAVVRAFGGAIAFQPGAQAVTAVLPRAELTGVEPSASGLGERFTLHLSAPVPYSSYFNDTLNTLQLRFERTDATATLDFDGRLFVSATVIRGRGATEFVIRFDGEVDYRLFDAPRGDGFDLVIDLAPRRQEVATPADAAPLVVIDPGHGGADDGLRSELGSEEALALAFARRLADALEARGVRVLLTRDGDVEVPIASRSSRGVGADLFVSVHLGPEPPGSYRAYYLDEAAGLDDLAFAVRQNAEAQLDAGLQDATTDALRRQILLDLVPDLAAGRRYADALGGALFGAAGYSALSTAGAPLAVLAGAAGRGLLLEFGAADLASDRLPEELAAALVSVLGDAGP